MPYKYSYDYEEKEYIPRKLRTNRSMWEFMILTIITFGIYGILFFAPFTADLDKVAPKRDRSKTMNYLFVFILAWFTFSIVMQVWHYQVAERVEEGLSNNGIDYEFTTGDFWKWLIFGSFIIVGPFVYYHKLFKAMNLLCKHYNEKRQD